MIYSTSQQESIIYQAQVWLADLGVKLESYERSLQPCEDLYCKGYKVRTLITAIQKTNSNLEDYEKEKLYTCLVETTGIKDYPVFSPITTTAAPSVIIGQPGPAGPQGVDGIDGTNANVENVSLTDDLVITSAVDPGDPTKVIWSFDLDFYVEAMIALNLDPSTTVYETGDVQDITLNITLTKGRDDVIASTITSDAGLNTTYQGILDLAGLNAGGPAGRSVIDSGVASDTSYSVNIDDGTIIDVASRSVVFVYPFFYGNSENTGITFYSALTKLIETQGNKTVPFAGTDDYFWFGYPDTYPDLTSIKDQNGFEVVSAFTKSAELVTSTGLDVNWTDVGYTFYRTTAKTTINGSFTFTF